MRVMPECKVENCQKPVLAKSLCSMHYHRVRKYGSFDLPKQVQKFCFCGMPELAKGYCSKHYSQVLRLGKVIEKKFCRICGSDVKISKDLCKKCWGKENYRDKVKRGKGKECSIEGCIDPAIHNTYCSRHYYLDTRYGDPHYKRAVAKDCIFCGRPTKRQGTKCGRCTWRLRNGKSLDDPVKGGEKNSPKCYLDFIDKRCRTDEDGCRLWLAASDDKGYGVISINGEYTKTHRVVYAFKNDMEISDLDGFHIHHKCRKPNCCRLKCLRKMTPAEHVKLHHEEGDLHPV